MSCDWGRVPLSSLGKIVTGKTPPSKVIDAFVNGSVPFVTPRDLDDRKWIKTTERYLSNTGLESVKGNIVPAHSVAVSCIGSDMGKARLLSVKSVTNQQINTILVNSELHNPEYIYYVLSTKQQSLKDIAGGSATPILNKSHFGQFEIDLPSKGYQDAVVDVLRGLDSKIEINTQTNQTLEQMAQAIFKSWFVDFDPVKAKMRGEQPEGMDEATASLFPEKLVESELGLIPEGWEVETLDSHTSMIIDHRGKTPKKLGSDWVEEGYPAISAKNIKSKKIVRPDTIRFLDEATYKKWMKVPLIKGDIIMTSEAPMGELYFFDGSRDFCLSQRLYGLRANPEVCNPVFLFNWLQTTQAKADMEGRASGSTVLGIKQAELRKVKILTPPKNILDKYSSIASNLIDMTAKNNAQNISLEELRDTLLPKLLSGEIELAEKQEN
ncbi:MULTISPECIES: restriction endonuclease subunit S [Shewanella]|uniref:restriction endonuclease subunit S n=1 Tax=Shewanella TaxID=22 RepID=UPI00217CE3E4|nr:MULTISPECIES: restriction endonuclease subunit S [Shewanella]MCS6098721.1 restriction endonuclease subunit S [Shewanella baltica]MCS6181907.1 restriction endonuclease subunit S [Shewanella baltica]MCU8014820.1 restriction endonuclease subunit S [Shewanella sp. SM74]